MQQRGAVICVRCCRKWSAANSELNDTSMVAFRLVIGESKVFNLFKQLYSLNYGLEWSVRALALFCIITDYVGVGISEG